MIIDVNRWFHPYINRLDTSSIGRSKLHPTYFSTSDPYFTQFRTQDIRENLVRITENAKLEKSEVSAPNKSKLAPSGRWRIIHQVKKKSDMKFMKQLVGFHKAPLPIGSMYGVYTYIYHENQPSVGKYTSPMDPMGIPGDSANVTFLGWWKRWVYVTFSKVKVKWPPTIGDKVWSLWIYPRSPGLLKL